MRYFILSQPKSGTYLCANLLQNFGLDFTYMHISNQYFEKYDRYNLPECRKHPSKYRTMAPVGLPISHIKDNQFAVGHLNHEKENIKALKSFKKIVLIRDAKETLESFKCWAKETGKKGYRQTYPAEVLPWLREPETFLLDFSDMIEERIKILDQLQEFLFGELVRDSKAAILVSKAQDSLTKSNKRK